MKIKGSDLSWNRAVGGIAESESWANGGKGGINVTIDSIAKDSVKIEAYGGLHVVKPDQPLTFNFSIIITPVKGDYPHTIEGKTEHYDKTRIYHVPFGTWKPPLAKDLKADLGVNVEIIHQSNRLNPFINYPFYPSVVTDFIDFIQDAKEVDVKVKTYYTIGQLSNHAVELFAMIGLNGEVINRNLSDVPPSPGGTNETSDRLTNGMGACLIGNEWLEERLVHNFMGGWFTLNPDSEDASISTDTTSRLMNYYVEGKKFLYDNVGLAWLYYDGLWPSALYNSALGVCPPQTPLKPGSIYMGGLLNMQSFSLLSIPCGHAKGSISRGAPDIGLSPLVRFRLEFLAKCSVETKDPLYLADGVVSYVQTNGGECSSV